MGNLIVSDRKPRLSGGRYPHNPLGRIDRGFASREADKPLVKMIEPSAECGSAITCGISRNEDHFDLIRKILAHFPEAHSDIRHVEWTLIWATGVSKKQERDVS